jgi:rhodanese-related sulfurtransferase
MPTRRWAAAAWATWASKFISHVENRPIRRDSRAIADWGKKFRGRSVVVICKNGLERSEAVAAWLRHAGSQAKHLAGGFEAWLSTAENSSEAEGEAAVVHLKIMRWENS